MGCAIGWVSVAALSVGVAINEHLTALHLSQNAIQDKGSPALSSALRGHVSLRELHVYECFIDYRGCIAMIGASGKASCLSTLDLSNNHLQDLQDVGETALGDMLKALSSLTVLELLSDVRSVDTFGPPGFMALCG